MFIREKFSKSTQFFSHSNASKNIVSSNKYFQKPFQKKCNQISKKQKSGRNWKKNSSNYWSEKENDINNINNPHNNKKFYFESKKSFRYHKKISKTKFDYNYTYAEEESENIFDNVDELSFSKKNSNSKDEKNNSIEYTTTTAYSNSNYSSAHEDINIKDNLIPNNFDNKDSKEIILVKKNSDFEINNNNNIINNDLTKDLSNQFFSNLMKINMNLIKLNSNNNIPQIQKKQNYKKKYSNLSSNSSNFYEQYNKYNTINQDDLDKSLINPMVENTEILNVSVKISKNKRAMFKLRRFDDLFLTVKLFCEIHQIEERFIRPIIIKTLCSLNSLYLLYNTNLDEKILQRLKRINTYINII